MRPLAGCPDSGDPSRATEHIEHTGHAVIVVRKLVAELEAQSLHHGPRSHVADLGVGDDLILAQLVEGESDTGLPDLRRVTVAPVFAVQHPADLQSIPALQLHP
jgi:hypothetical protein